MLVSAGFDAHRADPLASCELEAGSFAEMARHVRELGAELDAPVGMVLEGGYDLTALAASVVATIEALSDATVPGSSTRPAAPYLERGGRSWSLA